MMSYREGNKVRKKTIANLSHCSKEEIQAIKLALKHKGNLYELGSIQDLECQQDLSVGSIWTVYQAAKQLGIVKALGKGFNSKLALWQIISRAIEQGSRLSSVRLADTYALSDVLNLTTGFNEDDLYANLDWISKQQDKVEDRLYKSRQQKSNTEIFLYDVTSSYLEGEKNHFGEYGCNRDREKGKKQIVIGLLCNQKGDPLSVEVFHGNTNDTKTFPSQVRKVAERFGGKNVTFVGDRGMIKIPQINKLPPGFHYITAMTSSQIRTFADNGTVQMEFFDNDVFEIENDGIRYIMRRNPYRAQEIKKNRYCKYENVKKLIDDKNRYLREHKRARVDVAVRIVQEKIEKMEIKKWLNVSSNGRNLSLFKDEESLAEISSLDGCYMLKTDLPKESVSKEIVHDRYKYLAKVETAFRSFKQNFLEVRPLYVRKELRTRGHVFIVMLSYMIVRRLREIWSKYNLTVEEGLNHLSKIISLKKIISGIVRYREVILPDSLSNKLLKALDIKMPRILPYQNVNVVTKKKLLDRRITP